MADSPFDSDPAGNTEQPQPYVAPQPQPPTVPSPQYPAQYPPQYPPAAPQIGQYYSNQQGFTTSGISNDAFAITSLVCGLIPCGLVTGIIAIVFGFLAKSRIKKSDGYLKGSGMATAGIVLGIFWIVLTIVYYVVMVALAVSDPATFQ